MVWETLAAAGGGSPGKAIGDLSSALFGDSSSSEQNMNQLITMMQQISSQSQTDSSMSQQSNDIMSALQSMLQQSTGETVQFSTEQQNQLSQTMQQLMKGVSTARQNMEGATERGTALSEDAMQAAISEVMRTGIGEVAAIGANTGAYDSTSQGQAASRLSADAARAGSEVRLNTIMQQQGLASDQLSQAVNSLNQLFSVAKGGVTRTSEQVSAETSTDQTSESSVTGEQSQTSTSEQTTDSTTETDTTTSSESKKDGLVDTIGGWFS